uniref:Uncharacterized protein n=1 Tax=Eutreptiella gymnastica TaxID=73025 RepID=A0A6U8NUK0_9EUGL
MFMRRLPTIAIQARAVSRLGSTKAFSNWFPTDDLYKKPASGPVTVKSLEEARKMDEADGVIDGKFHGQDIEIEGIGTYAMICGTSLTPTCGVDAVAEPQPMETIEVKTMSEAEALDAADGVIDGKYHGAEIHVQGLGLYSTLMHRIEEAAHQVEQMGGATPDAKDVPVEALPLHLRQPTN